MQASDVIAFIDNATYYISLAIILFAVYRGITIGRKLVNRVYRRRAFLVSILILFIVIQTNIPDWSILGLSVVEVSYFALLFFFLAVIDNTILVALDMDFFHRNTARWRQTRFGVYSVFLIDVILIIVSPIIDPGLAGIGRVGVLGSFASILVYATVVLVLASRRTPDRTMRRFLIWTALLLLITLVFTLLNRFSNIAAIDLFLDFLGIAQAYVLYALVMSLSLTGKRVEESSQASIVPAQ